MKTHKQQNMKLVTYRADIITKEKDPIKREILSAGYTHMIEDVVSCKIELINKHTKYIKTIDLREYKYVVMQLTYKIGSNLAGGEHIWLTELDGSAGRFRELIKPY